MSRINIACFDQNKTPHVYGIWQWDYGQVLRIQGLMLPTAVEIHFSLLQSGGEAVTRIGVTKDRVTDVTIPDSLLENGNTASDYRIYAFIYLSDVDSGQTEYRITMSVKSRPKPEAWEKPEDAEIFREAIAAVNADAEAAGQSAAEAESWAHGRDDYPDRADDNAAYYAGVAKDALEEIPGEVEDAKKAIDVYVKEKESQLKGETGNVYFAAFKVVNGRLIMYSDPEIDKVRFVRIGSRMVYRLNF